MMTGQSIYKKKMEPGVEIMRYPYTSDEVLRSVNEAPMAQPFTN